MIDLVSSEELARRFGYAGPNDSFRTFCRSLGIRPIRRNPHFFDTKHVRLQLDAAQGISERNVQDPVSDDLVAKRRARRAPQ